MMKPIYILMFIFLIGFVSGEGLNNPYSYNLFPDTIIDNSVSSNISNVLNTTTLGQISDANSTQFTNVDGILNVDETFFNGLYCELNGCAMDGDINMALFDIRNVDNLFAPATFNIDTGDQLNLAIDGTVEVALLDGFFLPALNNDVDLGSTGIDWKDIYYAGTLIGGGTGGGAIFDDVVNMNFNAINNAFSISIGSSATSKNAISQPNVFGDSTKWDLDADFDNQGFLQILMANNGAFQFSNNIFQMTTKTANSGGNIITLTKADSIIVADDILFTTNIQGTDSLLRNALREFTIADEEWGSDKNNASTIRELHIQDGTNTDNLVNVVIRNTAHRQDFLTNVNFTGDISLESDTAKFYLGLSQDVSQTFDGTNYIINAEVGTPNVSWTGFNGYVFDKNFTNTDLLNCDTIDTDANGLFSCGTDGGGGADVKSGSLIVTENSPVQVVFTTAFTGTPYCAITPNEDFDGTDTAWVTQAPNTTAITIDWDDGAGGGGVAGNVSWICTDGGDT